MKQQVIDLIKKEKLISVIRGVKKEKLEPLLSALYVGGVRIVEITFDPTENVTALETARMISEMKEKFEGKLCVGAGTVLDMNKAEAAYSAGAEYLISPNVVPEVIGFCNKHEVTVVPGAMTPTEITCAYGLGADFVKIFPAESLGLSYIKAVRAPLPHIPMITNGGVNENNILDFLAAGVDGVGVGSNIAKKNLIDSNDFEAIAVLAGRYTAAVRTFSSKGQTAR